MASTCTQPSPIYYLSQELIDKFIDTTYYAGITSSDRRSKMAICSLVCKSFLPRAQKHLFAHIRLPINDRPRDYTRITTLAEIMHRRPAVASHIEKLSAIINMGTSTLICNKPEMGGIMDEISAALPHLRSLALKGYPCGHSVREHSDQIMGFIRPHIAPYITSLHLKYLKDLPPQVVSSCANLNELKIIFSTFLIIDRKATAISSPRIKHLELGGDRLAIDKVYSALHLDLSSLRQFIIYADSLEDLADVQSIINQSKGALEVMETKIYDRQEHTLSWSALDFSNQPRIRNFSYIASCEGPDSDYLMELCKTLRTIPTPSNLTTLELTIIIGLENIITLESFQELVLAAEWERLGRQVISIAAAEEVFTFWLIFEYHVFCLMNEADSSETHRFEREAEEAGKRIFDVIEGRLGIHDSISCTFNTALSVEF